MTDEPEKSTEIETLERELAEDEFFRETEKEWKKTAPRLSEVEWLEVFPEARSILHEKIKEWQEEKQRLIDVAKKYIRKTTAKDYWETRITLQLTVVPRIAAAEKHIARLRRLIASTSPQHATADRMTDADIQYAKAVPITSLLSSDLRKTGRTITTHCPLHADHSPSFVVYPETNTCWCFGCQQGGDSIAFARLLHGLTFIDAVKFLQRV